MLLLKRTNHGQENMDTYKQAAPILGELEFEGMSDKLILVEHEEENFDLVKRPLFGKVILLFTPILSSAPEWPNLIAVQTDSIYKITKSVRQLSKDSFDWIIIDRIDLMDLDLCKKSRGAQIKGHLSMLSPKILQGKNIIVTSHSTEYMLRELADQFLNLRK